MNSVWPQPDTEDYSRLEGALRGVFGPKAHCFPTPAMTGKYLWTLTRAKADYPPMPADLQTLYHATTGQGRVEMTPTPSLDVLPAIYLYDLRFAYGACIEHLPTGTPIHTSGDAYARYTQGRYHVQFTVPAAWNHLGVFMCNRERGPGRWFPAAPGYVGDTWASGPEIALAREMGWDVAISESIIFPDKPAVPRPLDAWRGKLLRLWDDDAWAAPYARMIVLQTIGAFHQGSSRKITVAVARGDERSLPRDNPTINMERDGSWSYQTDAPSSAWQADYSHPEWTAEIWARARTRLLRHTYRTGGVERAGTEYGALTVPRAAIVAIRTDALYTTAPMPTPPTSAPGYFRLKAHAPGPMPTPPDAKTLRAMIHEPDNE